MGELPTVDFARKLRGLVRILSETAAAYELAKKYKLEANILVYCIEISSSISIIFNCNNGQRQGSVKSYY